MEYNINIYSEVWINESWYESNPLHLKLKKMPVEHVATEGSETGEETHGPAKEVPIKVIQYRAPYYISQTMSCQDLKSGLRGTFNKIWESEPRLLTVELENQMWRRPCSVSQGSYASARKSWESISMDLS